MHPYTFMYNVARHLIVKALFHVLIVRHATLVNSFLIRMCMGIVTSYIMLSLNYCIVNQVCIIVLLTSECLTVCASSRFAVSMSE